MTISGYICRTTLKVCPRQSHRSASRAATTFGEVHVAGPDRLRLKEAGVVSEWWTTFFDQDYFRIWKQLFSEEANAKQAADFWSMLDLTPGSSVLDAPCGWGRLSRPPA